MNGRVHSREFKLMIVHQLVHGEKRPAQICREYQLASSLVSKWCQEYDKRGEATFTPVEPIPAEALEQRVAEGKKFCGQLVLDNAVLKKALILSLLFLLTVSLGACTNGESKLASRGNIENKVSIGEKVENKNSQQQPDVKNDVDYNVIELDYLENNDKLKYDIKYPQISGLSDTDKQRRINSTLKDEALKVLKYYENPSGSVELRIVYKVVLANPNILSIQYSGSGSVSNAAHPNDLFFTTNINIETGDRVRLKDTVHIDKNFAHKFLNGEFKALRPEQGQALKQWSIKDVQEKFNEADSLDNIGTAKQSDVFSYFTNHSLGISISVGHALGDHAEFETKYQAIKNNIKTGSGIWKGLLH